MRNILFYAVCFVAIGYCFAASSPNINECRFEGAECPNVQRYIKENPCGNPHTCDYKLCPFTGQYYFANGCGNCDIGSDCYYLDKLHFEFPAKSYDELDSLLFSPVK